MSPSERPGDSWQGRVFALTGGIGSGKSSVASIWREQGLPVVDADQVARAALDAGSPGLRGAVELFGGQILSTDGQLDRKALAARVFADESLLSQLNALVHPLVHEEVRRQFQFHAEAGAELIAYEIPLLFETHQEKDYRPVVVVQVPESEQLLRACRRDDVSREHIQKRMDAQLPLGEKVARADIVINNAGTQSELRAHALAALEQVRAFKGHAS